MFKDCILIVWAPDAAKLESLPSGSVAALMETMWFAPPDPYESFQYLKEKFNIKDRALRLAGRSYDLDIVSLNLSSAQMKEWAKDAHIPYLRFNETSWKDRNLDVGDLAAVTMCLLGSSDTRYIDTL
jgi:hypothetical protein